MIKKLTVIVLAVALVFSFSMMAEANEPIKIGGIAPITGTFAGLGSDTIEGIRMALEEVDYEIAGREIELFTEDTGGNTSQLLSGLDALEIRDEVDIILGPVLGGEGMAMIDWASDTDIPIIVTYSAPEDVTMRRAQPNVARAGWTGAQVMFDFGAYVVEDLGYNSVVIIGQDYAFPYNQAGGFMKGFYLAGGERVERIWHPIGTDDYSSIFATMPLDVDAALVITGGDDAIRFVSQWFDFGMDEDLPLLASANTVEPTVLPEIGDIAIGIQSSMHFAEGIDRPEFIDWAERYQEMFGKVPSAASDHGYTAARMALMAIEEMEGNIEDREEFMNIVRATEIPDAPRGPFRLDEYGNPIQNVYIKEVREVDGRLTNVVLETYEDVSQFGPFKDYPELYMSLPEHSASFPPDTQEEFFELLPEDFLSEFGF
ncbi:ABC transporter substrate-binding protein [Halanaerobiaceae bacterium Z-7014]|uniref:ABC transporter substrate-binding protein n=1 Tax=Halonatronomonas betaini TaxID=2778430 RepID=A0A931F6Y6_9FIRM|nr:ABC transporter substrate-binding protein [Halonatronomonas betaini]MBF8436076.1 ABC transporter substrate-binding protein [Halonatronomonas betaini]